MLHYPEINPVALAIGSIKVYWYGLIYLLSFAIAWALSVYRAKKYHLDWTNDQITDLIFYSALGVVIGGRIGYVLFYGFDNFLHNPLVLFKIWQGGMSFHGGLIGVAVALWLYGRSIHKSFFTMGDFIVPVVPIGLGLGRIGNFINGELWGRTTDMPWGMIYPHVDNLPRHPSQIYEFLTEGVLLFIILWFYSAKPRPKMAVSAVFLIFYGLFRIINEFFRQPDTQIGFIAFGWLTKGQLLSLPMLLIGIFLLIYAYKTDKQKR